MENYYRTLPEGYRTARIVDAKEKKTSVRLMAFASLFTALPLTAVIFAAGGLKSVFAQYSKAEILTFQ